MESNIYTKENPLKVVTLCSDKDEEWKSVTGYEGIYEVSNIGRVRSMSRRLWNGHSYIQTKERILKPNTLAKGYLQVTLYKGKSRKCFQVHRLVAGSFIQNPLSLPQVNHKNGDKKDNRVENLEWCNNSENQIHAWKIGLQKPHYCCGGADKKKRVLLLKADGSVERVFESIKAASKFLGCPSPANLSHLLNGKGRLKSIYGRKLKFA